MVVPEAGALRGIFGLTQPSSALKLPEKAAAGVEFVCHAVVTQRHPPDGDVIQGRGELTSIMRRQPSVSMGSGTAVLLSCARTAPHRQSSGARPPDACPPLQNIGDDDLGALPDC